MPGLDLSTTFGVVYWGFVIATILFGISIVQGYFFFLGSKDSRTFKCFVGSLLALDFATTALASESLHYYLIINFGNPLALLLMSKSYIAEHVSTLVIIFASQLFYAGQIYAVNKRVWIPLLIFTLAVCSFGVGLALTYEMFAIDLLIANISSTKIKICLGLATSLAALCDIISTIAMCCFLTSHRSIYKETNTLLRTFLFFAINRGTLTAVAQICHLAMFLAYPSRAYWVPFHLSVSKLHVNTLLAILNTRAILRARADAKRLEITTDFASAQMSQPRFGLSSHAQKRTLDEQAITFDLVDLPGDKKLPRMRSIEEGLDEMDSPQTADGTSKSLAFGGEVEPITFA
ncbi:hypothetical protein DFH11DRAFT_1178312 [Phellopilus nigrolimitatus]|nr:hypothetical protein DFH11DRAFT_1178312 [Phellopilus nigrolimitatus]